MSEKDVLKDAVCVNGRFSYAIKHRSLHDGHSETGAYIDNQRRLGARFFEIDSQGGIRGEMHLPRHRIYRV